MDDTISRRAAIDALDEYIEEYSFDLDENGYHNPKWCAMQEAKMTIQRLPSAERMGRWEDYSDDGYYECSVCGEAWTFIDGTPKDNNANYCPMCGARMEASE